MENDKLISVVVVGYNHSKYIIECLESIRIQTYLNWELVVADDASVDNSTVLIDEWVDKNGVSVKKLYHKKNTGFCRVLNECLTLSTGDYIKIISADDKLDADYLTEVISVFKKGEDDLGMIFTNATFFNDIGLLNRSFFQQPPNLGNGYVFKSLMKENFVPALTAIIKREVFEKVGRFDEEIWIEDWEFWLRMAKEYRIFYVDKKLAYYRQHDSNVSSNKDKMIFGQWKILLKYGNTKEYKINLNNFIRDNFNIVKDREKFVKLYSEYAYKNGLLMFFVKRNLPRKLYRLCQKIFT